ncbi:SdpI family protein [Corynebacterium phocae]|nr:SdpI family protein [Corynebacterium phocae]
MWIGIRTPALLASDEGWIEGHKAAAPYLIASSIPLFAGGVFCLFAQESLLAWVGLPVVTVMLLLVLIGSQKANSAVK